MLAPVLIRIHLAYLCLRCSCKSPQNCSSLIPRKPVVERKRQACGKCCPGVPVIALCLAPCCIKCCGLQLGLHKCSKCQQICLLQVDTQLDSLVKGRTELRNVFGEMKACLAWTVVRWASRSDPWERRYDIIALADANSSPTPSTKSSPCSKAGSCPARCFLISSSDRG